MKIAFLCDGFHVKAWQARLVKDIVSKFNVNSVYIISQNVEIDNSIKVSGEKSFLWKLYQKIDVKVYDRLSDLNNVDIRDVINKYVHLELNTKKIGIRDYVESCSKEKIDVAIRLGWRIVDGDILKSFKHGILSLHHGDNRINRGGPWCFWEMFLKQPLTGVTLQVLNEQLDAGNVIERGFVKTDYSSLMKNRSAAIEVGHALIIKHLNLLEKMNFLEYTSDNRVCYDKPVYKTPTNINLFIFLYNLVSFVIKRKLVSTFFNEHWGIAFKKRNGNDINLSNIKILPDLKSSFIADPFVFSKDNQDYIFYERYCYVKRKGVISVYDINTGTHNDIIEESYHLSFPFIFSQEGKYYIIPQSENNSVDLYQATEFPLKWEKVKALISSSSSHYADAIIEHHDSIYFLIVNEYKNNFDSNRYMNIYYSSSLFGDFYPHVKNPVKIDDSSSRNAGKIQNHNGDLIRLSQDCKISYGHSINIMKIDKLTIDDYQESIADEIKSDFINQTIGVHTLNYNERFIVTDFKTRKLKLMCKL